MDAMTHLFLVAAIVLIPVAVILWTARDFAQRKQRGG
jgi:hypothetical protein